MLILKLPSKLLHVNVIKTFFLYFRLRMEGGTNKVTGKFSTWFPVMTRRGGKVFFSTVSKYQLKST